MSVYGHANPDYLAPGAVWGTVVGAVTVIGPSARPLMTQVVVQGTGQVLDMILTERHSSPSLPGYTGMYRRLPRRMWPRKPKSN